MPMGRCRKLERLRHISLRLPQTVLYLLAAGIVGGVLAAGASHPFDTIKTRMQAFMYTKPEYATMWSTAQTIYREGGIASFWRGNIPRMSRIIVATMVLNTLRTKTVAHLEAQRS